MPTGTWGTWLWWLDHCVRSCFDGPTEPFLCDIIGSIIDQRVPFLDPSSFVIFFFSFLSAAQKKSLVFGVKILLSANLFAWLHISDNMIGLQKSIMVQILVRLPMYALVTFNYLWYWLRSSYLILHLGRKGTTGLANVSAAWRKFTWIKSSEKQDSMKVTWPLV